MKALLVLSLAVIAVAAVFFVGRATGVGFSKSDSSDVACVVNGTVARVKTTAECVSLQGSGGSGQAPTTASNNNPPSTGPTPKTGPTPVPPHQAFTVTRTIPADQAEGLVIDGLTAGESYTFSVTGSYNTGINHNRSVVAVFMGNGSVHTCNGNKEPCADFWVGSFDDDSPATVIKSITATSVRVVLVDDNDAYPGNTGSVTLTITGQ